MTETKRLCINMIVKNEMANIERCLGAVADHIACWVIGDTGSTDGTQDFIKEFFAKRNIPGELHSFPFHNFEQARNAALDHAYASSLDYDYILFDDADMELVVDDVNFKKKLVAPGYRLLQRTSDGLAYWNTRLVRRDAGARYHGVTHEYIDVPGGVEELPGAWYIDHASGSNRTDKFERDIRLLKSALETEPENVRYWFYLAQSYRDAGRTAEAAETYAKRAEMGGWDEEAWMARLQQARCLRGLGDEGGFVSKALQAFNQRPQRAEPLYDLARYYREKGLNHASFLFSEPGLAMEIPEQDILFIENYVYQVGLREEFSIAANYAQDWARKDRGYAACNWLATNRSIPDGPRELAWSNLFFYLQPAKTLFPSFFTQPVGYAAPEGYRPMNPSVSRHGDEIYLVQRTANFRVVADGLKYETDDGEPVRTRNFLLRLNRDDLAIQSALEILAPTDFPPPQFEEVRGFEDLRLFSWRGALWGSACVRELTAEGWCEQIIARIGDESSTGRRLTDWRVLQPDGPRLHQKNWMPQIDGDDLRFVYLCDPTRVLDDKGKTVSEAIPGIAAKNFRGGTQLVEFDGGWLALIHEVQWRSAEAQRYYHHRFVWFDRDNNLRRMSRPFFFNQKGIEFAAGLAWHPDERRLLVAYGVGDGESWLASIDAIDVQAALEDIATLPSGEAGEKGVRSMTDDYAARSSVLSSAKSPSRPPQACDPEPQHSQAHSPADLFLELAPFLRSGASPRKRRDDSRNFDARIERFLAKNGSAVPQIHCFYEASSDAQEHPTLLQSLSSMRAAGHPVRVWSYSPHRFSFAQSLGVDVRNAEDVVPRELFERITAGSEIRYFSDIFRYAVLYEHGGLWMDTDIILLRPFPFRGDHFFNLQWSSGPKNEHFICGNVIYAEPYSRHMRALYEQAIQRSLAPEGWEFGAVGPKLLSDYIASEAGAPLRERVFSPVFFNAIDWNEIAQFERPISDLSDFLSDERVFGLHLWTARNPVRRGGGKELISVLFDISTSFPPLVQLADRFNTDKNRHTGNRHSYARIYDGLLSSRRFSLRRLMEIGLCRGLAEGDQTETPSVALWQTYFPFCEVLGVDLTDFSKLNNQRFKSFVCDQSKIDDLRTVASSINKGSLDVIIDDGSHASYDEQLTLREFFPLLAAGGWYFIEDLDWQPPGEDRNRISLTKDILKELKQCGRTSLLDPLNIGELASEMADILFFDSHYELTRARLMGGLVAIRKRG